MIIIFNNIIKVSTNEIYAGVHWRKRKRMKDNYLLMYKIQLRQIRPCTNKVNLFFHFYFKSKKLDSSNCSYMAKILEDCLVTYKVLKNDSNTYVGMFGVQSHKSKKGKEYDYCCLQIENCL